MQACMNNPALVLPAALQALRAFADATELEGLPVRTRELCHLRASQINGRSVCLDMHARHAQQDGETEQRLFTVGAWRDAPFFSEAERAALALTESVTRLSDRDDPVPDEVWAEAARHDSLWHIFDAVRGPSTPTAACRRDNPSSHIRRRTDSLNAAS